MTRYNSNLNKMRDKDEASYYENKTGERERERENCFFFSWTLVTETTRCDPF
jgi:hypothetical protein